MRRIQKNKLAIQLLLIILILYISSNLLINLSINLSRSGMNFSFNWLLQPAGFELSETSIPYNPSDSYLWALLNSWMNSLKVITCSLILSTIIGILIGIFRIVRNKTLRMISSLYIILIRQTPLLLQLLFWYFVAFMRLPSTPFNFIGSLITASNQGLILLGLPISIEFSALVLGLTIFTSASIAEVVRGGIASVDRGQWEAFKSLGIDESYGIRKVIIPQAFPAIIPGLTSQYLNLAKNSTLAIAIGYADLYAVSDTIITQTGRAIEGFLILLTSFLMLNLLISSFMEILNKYSLRHTKSQ